MPYIHFGRIGDIWKHLPLAKILKIEKPGKYIESNSASSIYSLSATPEQRFGIYHFIENAYKSHTLQHSEYYNIIKSFNPDVLKRYPGSSVISLCLLKNDNCNFFFYDIDNESLNNLQKYVVELRMTDRCQFLNEDSITGILKQLEHFDNNTFIHFDPYDIFAKNKNGLSYLDIFFEAQNKGIKAMLWYGFMTLNDKKEIYKLIKERINNQNRKNLICIEVFLKCIKENSVLVNPGIIGSGIIACNLSKESEEILYPLSSELKLIYKGSTLFEKYKGDLEAEQIEY